MPTAEMAVMVPAPAPRHRLHAVAAYAGGVVLTLIVLVPVLRLNKADLRIPLYEGTDCYFYTALIKNIVAGHYYVNPRLGAPGVQELYDFALPHLTHWLLWKSLCVISGNYAVVLNIFYLLTFPLITLFSMVAFRQFGVSYAPALFGGVLFAFLPYHLIRAEKHLTYSSYYMVPLAIMVMLWIVTGEPLFAWDFNRNNSAPLISHKGIASLVICCLAAWDNPYQAFFTTFLLAVAGVLSHFRYRYGRLKSAAVLAITVLLAFGLNLTPNFLYQRCHGENPQAVQRLTEEAEIYGLKMAQLVLPITGHRIPAFAKFKAHYNVRAQTFAVNENDWSSLGAIGTCGFLYLLALLFFRAPDRSNAGLSDPLSFLTLAAFLMGTIGGFGALFALLVSRFLRGYNRICVFIAFFSLFAVVLGLDAVFKRIQNTRRKLLFPCLLAMLVLGLMDQTSKYYVPQHRALQNTYRSDEAFFQQVQASVTKDGMVFQLPYLPFPEGGGRFKMADYDHIRAYLHTTEVHWSYGAMKGRDVDSWQAVVSAMPVPQMAQRLAFAGFAGIYINRDGFPDHGAQLEAQLRPLLNCEAVISSDQRLVFFSLANLQNQLRAKYVGAAWGRARAQALSPLPMNL